MPTCRFCGAPRQYTEEAALGFPAGYPFECECVSALYDEYMAAKGYTRTDRGYIRTGAYIPQAKRNALRIEQANIPARYKDAKTVRELGSYYFFGGAGTGKTSEACALLIKAIQQGKKALFVSVSEIVNQGFEAREKLTERMQNMDVLCIDDLGKETGEYANTLVFFAIDNAYARQKMLIVTSNYAPKELGQRLKDGSNQETAQAVVSRLCGMTQRVSMSGKDRRL